MTASTQGRELVVVTGASTGIGAATARQLAGLGFHVLAGVRRERDGNAIRDLGIEPLILDITVPDHIAGLSARVNEDPYGRPLRAVVNNAGIGINVPVEAVAIDDWRKLFEVNLFGHVAVTQTLLPALIRSRGRVVNISSVGGRVAMATYGPYAGTKFALEAVSDSLRREMSPLGVQVVVVEPGAVRTEMLERAGTATYELNPELAQRYSGLVHAVAAQAASSAKSGLSSNDAAKVIARAVTARKPRTRYAVGREAAIATRLARFVPDRMLDRLLAGALRPHMP